MFPLARGLRSYTLNRSSSTLLTSLEQVQYQLFLFKTPSLLLTSDLFAYRNPPAL